MYYIASCNSGLHKKSCSRLFCGFTEMECRARICICSPGVDSQPGWPIRQPYLSYRPARLHTTQAVGIDSSESIPGLHSRLKIRALYVTENTNQSERLIFACTCTEVVFLDVIGTKILSLLLHAIHSHLHRQNLLPLMVFLDLRFLHQQL
jgi:hypothetical protein